MASLEASGVDNCRIEVEMRNDFLHDSDEEEEEQEGDISKEQEDAEQRGEKAETRMQYEGYEMPVADGSAMYWADMIKLVQIRAAPSQEGQSPPPKNLFAPQKVPPKLHPHVTLACSMKPVNKSLCHQEIYPTLLTSFSSKLFLASSSIFFALLPNMNTSEDI